jgi:RNA polymerase sigma-70 factor (ECF subfamily)
MANDDEFLQATLPALDLVHNLARRFTMARADAEDLVQDTYLRAWQAWTAGTRPRRAEPWLATICLNVGRDRLRRAALRSEVAAEPTQEAPADVDVEAAAIGRVERAEIERALWALSEEQRIAIVLMDIVGFTAAEVATITGSPRGTVLARVHRGRKALARRVGVGEEVRRRDP